MAVRPGPGRTDLVSEMQQRSRAALAQAQARSRTMRRRTALVSVTIVVAALALTGIGKLALDEYRVHRVLSTAHARIAEGTPEDLVLALSSIERGLEIEPDHPEGRATLALVRSQQAIDGSTPVDSAEAAIAEAGDCTEAAVSRGIVAALQGDFDDAAEAIADLDPSGPNAPTLRRAQAWVQAQIALHDLDDPTALAPAIAAVEAALEEAPGWDRNHRAAAALYFRGGRVDQALEKIAEGRQLRPTDTGLLVDEALYHAVLQRDLDSIEQIVTQLLDGTPALDERDASRARLARAIARQYRDGDEAARSALDEAYEGLHAGDHRARALALEVALLSGASALAERWVDADTLPPVSTELHDAWVDFSADHVAPSLKRLAELPQVHPRVALVQGLALVEQGRFTEARTWLGRAQEAFPGRPALEVAMARVDAQLGDPGPAAERLEKLSKAYPRTPRVWTGLAEALTRQAESGEVPERAEAALQHALEHEAAPAQAAFLLSRRRLAMAATDPTQIPEADALLHRAVKVRDWVPTYRETLGRFLADVGDRNEARELLASIADTRPADPTSLLLLAELTAEHAAARNVVPPAEVATWLALAGQYGAPPAAVVHTNARIALMADTPEGLAQARAWVEPQLKANRGDLEARLIHVEVLRRQGDLKGARSSAHTGLRKTRRKREGRLLLALAEIERDSGKRRGAASLAYKGWRLAVREPRPANELLEIARMGIERWNAVDNTSGTRSIGRSLTRQVPYRAEAWTLRSQVQLDSNHPEEACASAAKAIALDDSLVDAHLAQAECALDMRDRKTARAALEKAAELTTDDAQGKAIRRRLRKLR